jgi:ABC-type transport system involved in multi-copper enzyme maturation permease subunit
MITSLRAELLRLLRWPITWVLGGTWLLLNLLFGYLFTYLTYRGGDDQFSGGATSAALLADMMPERAPLVLVGGLPLFGGALILILGALATGSGYGWGTWKTVFTAGPARVPALLGTFGALGVIVCGQMLLTFGADLLTSFVVATAENQPVTWPGLAASAQAFGAALLISGAWLAIGVLLGTLARGPALATGLGLVWALVVENLLRGVAGLLGPVEAVVNVLPGTAAGSLAGAVGAAAQGEANGTPGVLTTLSGPASVALLCAYVVAFGAATLLLTNRRDVVS